MNYICYNCKHRFDSTEAINPTIELYQICPKCRHKSGLPTTVDIRNL